MGINKHRTTGRQDRVPVKVSILLCTLPSRVRRFLPNIIEELDKQAEGKPVEILYLGDNKKMRVGEKRNKLLELAKGDYVCFVDDDDWISTDYVDELLKGANSGADVFCFRVLCTVEKNEGKPVIYDARFKRDSETAKYYERLPNHLMLIRRDLAMIGFKEINFSEDSDFAIRLKPTLKTQSSTDKVLYYYNFSHSISETQ